MASEELTRETVLSIFGEIPPDLSSDDDNNPQFEQEQQADYDDETQENSEQAEADIIDIDGTNLDEEMFEEDVDEEFADFDEEGPQVGMVFKSRDELQDAYKAFGKIKGFGVSIRNCRHNYVIIGCDRGRKGEAAKKKTKRVDCQARLISRREDSGCWIVTKVFSTHNHELDPDMSKFMAVHRTITFGQKRHLENVDITGVPVCKNIRWLQVQAGGPGNLGCSERDCRNFIDNMRRLRLSDGDAAAIHNLLSRLQLKDPNFFHLMDIDDDCRLRNVMWIHLRSKAAYQDFHDVISFDTTYLVNRYHMPFATMVGVNQHHQSILLGCALLTHEQSQSFKWFFSNWLQAMGGVAPTAILTDQCDSIKNALTEVMPTTIHRLCIWHILYKLPAKFKGVPEYNKTATDFKNIIYDSLSIAEFERMWGEFIDEHGMSDNSWLEDLFAVRESWVPVYLNHIFWAGMRSTQRSESMHAFFDSYINSRSTLKTFVEQYEIAITNKTHKELEADYQSKCTYMKPRTRYAWEEQFGRMYTNNVFGLFQKEIEKVMNCNLTQLNGTSRDMLHGIESCGVLNTPLLAYPTVSVEWFESLRRGRSPLSTRNCDLILGMMIRKAKLQPSLFLDKWSVLDSFAWSVLSREDSLAACISMGEYVIGYKPQDRPMPWDEVDKLYGIAFIDENHFVAYCIDLEEERIVVYDSIAGEKRWPSVKSQFKGISTCMPIICRQLRGKGDRETFEMSVEQPWDVVPSVNAPQQDNRFDCGIISLKVIESLVVGEPFPPVDESSCRVYRDTYCLDMYTLSTPSDDV